MSGQWDFAFKLVLERLFALVGLSLQTEWAVGDLPLRIDGVVRCQPDDVARLAERTPFGFFTQHNLLECKSLSDRLTLDEFQRIVGRAYLYAANEKVRSHKDLIVCVICARRPRRLLQHSQSVATFALTTQGIYVTRSVGIPVHVVVVPELPAEPSTVFLRLFGDEEGRHEAIRTFVGLNDSDLIRIATLVYPDEVEEAMRMAKSTKAPDIVRNIAYIARWQGPEKVLSGLTPEERMAGLKPEDIVHALPPEELVRALSPEELARALSPEERRRWIALLETIGGEEAIQPRMKTKKPRTPRRK